MAKVKDKYFKVIANEGTTEAEILLYGVIGQDFWWSDELKEESITDLEFARTLRQLEAKYDRINIRINSPGGSMYHGNAIITAIQSSKAEIHTYNDGMAASMAGDIWLSAKHRHMAKNALLMIHSPSSWVWGTAKSMREEADVLDKFEYTIIAVMTETTGMSEEEIKDQFYDYNDHWLTAKECQDLNFITKIENYDAQDLIENVQDMSYQDLVKHFTSKNDNEGMNWLQQIKNKILRFPTKTINNQKSITDMNIDEIKKSLTDENLSLDDLADILKENGMEVTKKEETPPPSSEGNDDLAAIIEKAVKTATEPLQQEISTLKADVQKLGDEPGAGTTQTASDGDPYEGMSEEEVDVAKRTEAFNKKTIEAAQQGTTLKITR